MPSTRRKRQHQRRAQKDRRSERRRALSRPEVPEWETQRKKNQENPHFQKHIAGMVKRGTNRDTYLALQLLYQVSGSNYDQNGMTTIQTLDGPRRASRGVLDANRREREENARVGQSRRRNRRHRRAKTRLRRIETRGKHAKGGGGGNR